MKERLKCTCKYIVKNRGVVHTELDPRCPVHTVDHLTFNFEQKDFDENRKEVHPQEGTNPPSSDDR